jgi:hypothetical protein
LEPAGDGLRAASAAAAWREGGVGMDEASSASDSLGLSLPTGVGAPILFLMTLRNAVLLALVGVILATIVLVLEFTGDLIGVVRGLLPAMRLVTSFIYAFAGLSAAVFLYVFHKAQS